MALAGASAPHRLKPNGRKPRLSMENPEATRVPRASDLSPLSPVCACPADARSADPSSVASSHPAAYPLFVRLEGARVVVVGAGQVAERKIETLLSYGARVDVVSPQATGAVRAWASQGALTWRRRAYEEGDLEGARLVVGATGDRAVDEAVHAEACARNALVNIVDIPDLCTAIVPAIVRRGPLQIAVSTSGAAPSVARDVRRDLEERYPAHWAAYVELLGEVRDLVQARVPGSAEDRRPLYEAATRTDLLARLERGERPSAEDVYAETVAPLLGACRTDSPTAKEERQ